MQEEYSTNYKKPYNRNYQNNRNYNNYGYNNSYYKRNNYNNNYNSYYNNNYQDENQYFTQQYDQSNQQHNSEGTYVKRIRIDRLKLEDPIPAMPETLLQKPNEKEFNQKLEGFKSEMDNRVKEIVSNDAKNRNTGTNRSPI
jgi:hypothetical protein